MSNDDREPASPPCYQHQFDEAALVATLNMLVESERAGALR